jgi:hypothetical protein
VVASFVLRALRLVNVAVQMQDHAVEVDVVPVVGIALTKIGLTVVRMDTARVAMFVVHVINPAVVADVALVAGTALTATVGFVVNRAG